MIITRISGGLGNQFFQYAMGRNLAEKHHTQLLLDSSFYDDQSKESAFRTPTLSHFNISAREATSKDFAEMGILDTRKTTLCAKIRRKFFRLLENSKPFSERKLILEPSYQFVPELLHTSDNVHVSGIWQSEKYFGDIAGIIRKELTLKHPLSQKAEEVMEKVKSCNSISLHIRRGDYVQHQQVSALHGICSSEYYKEGLRRIANQVSEPTVFVFSDDIMWAKENLTLPTPTVFVSDESIPDYEELILMSSCNHHIIANSSFSWWSAWLNSSAEKIVVAPKIWFTGGQINTSDLLPESWITI